MLVHDLFIKKIIQNVGQNTSNTLATCVYFTKWKKAKQEKPSTHLFQHGSNISLVRTFFSKVKKNILSWFDNCLQPTKTGKILLGLHQGWKQTSLYLQVSHSTSHYITSLFLLNHSSILSTMLECKTKKNNNTYSGAFITFRGHWTGICLHCL